METQATFGSEQQFQLTQAILLYSEQGHRGNEVCAATVHPIADNTIGPGAPITLPALESLAVSLGRRLENTLLPERMLSISMSQMAWWAPAARRRIWFNPAENVKEKAALKQLNGKFVQHPPLLFIAGCRSLRIFALGASHRPGAHTAVYRAPYFNLSPAGVMCQGNVHLPDVIGATAMLAFEQAFFNSAFSHCNWGHRLTRHPRSHAGLWQEMSQRKSPFPARHLINLKSNLAATLKGGRYGDDE